MEAFSHFSISLHTQARSSGRDVVMIVIDARTKERLMSIL